MKKLPSYSEISYGSWLIRYSDQPNKNGYYQAIGYSRGYGQGNKNRTVTVNGSAISVALDKVRQIIRFKNKDLQKGGKEKLQGTLNIAFTKEIIEQYGLTGARIVEGPEGPILEIADAEWWEQFPKDMKAEGFKTLSHRMIAKTDFATEGYQFSLVQKEAPLITPNGRYLLEQIDSGKFGQLRFDMVFDSVTQSQRDKVTFDRAAITISAWT